MEDHIRAVIRIRPLNQRESKLSEKICTRVIEDRELLIETKKETKPFQFDYVADRHVEQEEFFDKVGMPITKNCLDGFNGTIICYGTTGTGKSHTTFGDGLECSSVSPNRGLVLRSLEYLFHFIENDQQAAAGKMSYVAKCSFYEIYQEKVYDLLDSSAIALDVREDLKRGVFVDGIVEEKVMSPQDAIRVLALGYKNRHVGQTTMNRESSRSHAVFTLALTVTITQENGALKFRSSRFTFVDLAGSERQKDTNSTGDQLKEAGQINKSLSTLGNVINSLTDKKRSSMRSRHVAYRDSKLTFLLRDSLGGNTKTVLVATLSPSMSCLSESLSTLEFAQRAKSIRIEVAKNEVTTGSVPALQKEIEVLKAEVARLQKFADSGGPAATSHLLGGSQSVDDDKQELQQGESEADGAASSAGSAELLFLCAKRCKAADEERTRAVANIKALEDRLKKLNDQCMTHQMKVKMRDSEIKKLKTALSKDVTAAGAGSGPGGVEDESLSLAEALKHERALGKDEGKAELLKYRLAYEEVIRRVGIFRSSSDEFIPPECIDDRQLSSLLDAVWSSREEVKFNHQLLARVDSAEAANAANSSDFEKLRDCKCQELFGFSLEEGSLLRAEAAEIRLAERERVLERDAALSQLEASKACLLVSQDEAQKRAGENESLIASLRTDVSALQEALALKTDAVVALEQEMLRTESDSRLTVMQREQESKATYNKCMKDNMVLIQECRKLEESLCAAENALAASVSALSEQKETSEAKIAALEETLTTRTRELALCEANLQEATDKIQQLGREMDDREAALKELEASMSIATASLSEAEELQHSLRTEITHIKRELEKTCFERDNAREDADNNYAQSEALLAEREQLVDMCNGANANFERVRDELVAMTLSVTTLQELVATHKLDAESKNSRIAELDKALRGEVEKRSLVESSCEAIQSSLSDQLSKSEQLQAEIVLRTEAEKAFEEKLCRQRELSAKLETENTRLFDRSEELLHKNEALQAASADTAATMEKLRLDTESKIQKLQLDNDQLLAKKREMRTQLEELKARVTDRNELILALEEARASILGWEEERRALRQAAHDAQGQVEEARRQLCEYTECESARLASYNQVTSSADGQLRTLERRLNETQKELEAKTEEAQGLKSDLSLAKESIHDLGRRITLNEEAAAEAQSQQQMLDDAVRKIGELQDEIAALSGHTNAKQKIHMLSKQSKEINDLHQKLVQTVKEKEEARNEVRRLREQLLEQQLQCSSKENRSPGSEPGVPNWIEKALGATAGATKPGRRMSRGALSGETLRLKDEGSGGESIAVDEPVV